MVGGSKHDFSFILLSWSSTLSIQKQEIDYLLRVVFGGEKLGYQLLFVLKASKVVHVSEDIWIYVLFGRDNVSLHYLGNRQF